MLPTGRRCAHVDGEIVLYVINTVIKLASEHFTARRREREGGNRQAGIVGSGEGDKEEGIEIRVSRHVFIRREAVTVGFYVFIYLSSRAVHTVSGYISTEECI